MTIYTLYVKTHNKTGLQYLGFTKQDPYLYIGSGLYWNLHLNQHGNDVQTKILHRCYSKTAIKSWGLFYSNLWSVVKSNKWANLKPESGDGGFPTGLIPWNKGKQGLQSAWNKGLTGEGTPMYGKVHKEESKAKTRNTLTGRKRPQVTPSVKTWLITYNNITEPVTNFKQWCATNSLNYQSFHRNIRSGKSYRGYIVTEIN